MAYNHIGLGDRFKIHFQGTETASTRTDLSADQKPTGTGCKTWPGDHCGGLFSKHGQKYPSKP